tara:strand:+ start:7326 stop:9713 length:2388 start_codon:yes stop_codon:yes gene_type:complete
MYSRIYFILLFLFSNAFGQVKVGEWSAYTSPLKINETIITGDSIICATSGGLLVKSKYGFNTLTTIDGLYGVDLSIIEKDTFGNLWLGGNTPLGFIQIYNFNIGSVEIFDFGLTQITDFYIDGENAFAAFIDGQDVGIVKFVYSNNNWSYRDIYRNFPVTIDEITGIEILQTTLGSEKNIFLATNVGLFLGNISTNLKDPNNWERGFCCFENSPIKAMTRYLEGIAFIFSATDNDPARIFYIYPNEEFYISRNLDIALPIEFDEMIFDNDDYLVGIKNKNIYSQRNGFSPKILSVELNDLVLGLNQEIIIGSDLGLKTLSVNMEILSFIPNAPSSSKFTALKVLSDGRLVGANSNGLSIKDFNGWRNILEVKVNGSVNINSYYDYNEFIADTIPYDFGDAVADIEEGPDGLVYIAIEGTYPTFSNPDRQGGGVLVLDIDDPSNIAVIDTSIFSYYTSSSSNRPYIVIKDIEFDHLGNFWVANAYAINKNAPIHVRSVDNIWRSYGSSETSTKISQSPISLAFDNWSRPWFGAFKAEEANLGVYPDGGIFVLDYEGDASRPSDFFWQSIIYNTTIWSIGFSGNRLYYLTTKGLNYFDINNGQNPVVGENLFSYFPNISFGGGSKVKVDKQGNIWTTSTTQGIHVLLENTTYWPTINGLRQNNSPLLSDEIYDIDFDEDRKLAYIATSKGISVLKIPFGESYDGYNKIKIFPSPFKLSKHEYLIADGLPFNSSMKVLALDGMVIRDIKSNGLAIDGDQLKWDGKNNNGDFVSSGVYLLSIIGSNGINTFEKITVIGN